MEQQNSNNDRSCLISGNNSTADNSNNSNIKIQNNTFKFYLTLPESLMGLMGLMGLIDLMDLMGNKKKTFSFSIDIDSIV